MRAEIAPPAPTSILIPFKEDSGCNSAGKRPHRELMARIGQCRHLLTLSAAEGFGVVPLESVAMGTTVMGFDGLGGRDYMRPGINCAVTAYPGFEGLADRIVAVLGNSALPGGRNSLSSSARRAPGFVWTKDSAEPGD
jgi:glycosyltransferase involved in cell wall biosynthesis